MINLREGRIARCSQCKQPAVLMLTLAACIGGDPSRPITLAELYLCEEHWYERLDSTQAALAAIPAETQGGSRWEPMESKSMNSDPLFDPDIPF